MFYVGEQREAEILTALILLQENKHKSYCSAHSSSLMRVQIESRCGVECALSPACKVTSNGAYGFQVTVCVTFFGWRCVVVSGLS